MLNHTQVKDRKCGDCTVCCTIMQVRELEKPLREACKHLCEKGCGIYEERPTSCKEFQCLWLQGHMGNEEQRPDKLGIMFTATEDHGKIIIHAWEVWEGASELEKVKYIFKKLGEKIVFMIRRIGKPMNLMGRRESIKKFIKIHIENNEWKKA